MMGLECRDRVTEADTFEGISRKYVLEGMMCMCMQVDFGGKHMSEGWQCPICKQVWSPMVASCTCHQSYSGAGGTITKSDDQCYCALSEPTTGGTCQRCGKRIPV